MKTLTSRDGTTIAYETTGAGPAVILVDGALCFRAQGPARPLASELAAHFTVYLYDRRGRGESTDTLPSSVDREIEDLEALVSATGEKPFLYGISSGAALALEAVNRGLTVSKLFLYEAPFIVDGTKAPLGEDYLPQLRARVAADRRGAAVSMFLKSVGMPGFLIPLMALTPTWKALKAVAPTLPYDIAVVTEFQQGRPLPADRWTKVKVPTQVAVGGKSPPWMKNAMAALAGLFPAFPLRIIDGQTHMLNPEAAAPHLIRFFQEGL